MAISYLGKETQDIFTLGSNQISTVNGNAGDDIIHVTANQTRDVEASQDTDQTIVFDAGTVINSVDVEEFLGNISSLSITVNTNTIIEINATTSFQIGGVTYATYTELKTFIDANVDYTVTGDEGAVAAPEFEVTSDVATVDEEASVATISIANGEANKDYAYSIAGVDAADIDVATMGTVTTDANGAATLAITTIADLTTEGVETMNVAIIGETSNVDVTVTDSSMTPAPAGTPATQVTVTAADHGGKTLTSLDDMGTTVEITDFVQGESLINVVDIFTTLTAGFDATADAANTVTANEVSYQVYGADILVYLETTGDTSVLNQTASVGDITLKLVAPVDANGNAITTLAATDFEGLPSATVFTADIDYDTTLTANDDIATVATATDINGLDLVDFGAGDDILHLQDAAGTAVLQSGNITGLETVATSGTTTVEVHDAFLAANGGNIDIDTTKGNVTTLSITTDEADAGTESVAFDLTVGGISYSLGATNLTTPEASDAQSATEIKNGIDALNITGLTVVAATDLVTLSHDSGDISISNIAYGAGATTLALTEADVVSTTIDTENVSGANTVTLAGTAAATLASGAANNNVVISDISGANTTSDVDGGDDVDTITAGTRADTIDGKAGADVIDGGAGSDTLTGGTGADTFDYNAVAESDGTVEIDTIKDFVWSEDLIDVQALTANLTSGYKTTKIANSVWAVDNGTDVDIYLETSGADWAAAGDEEMIIKLEAPTKADGTAITAADINFLDFIGVSPFTAQIDTVVGRTNDNTFTVSTAGTFDIDATATESNDTVDGKDGFDTIAYAASQSDGTHIFSATEIDSIEAIEVGTTDAATDMTIMNDFTVASQGNGTDNSTDTDTVLLTVADTNGGALTLDTSDLTTGTIALDGNATANGTVILANDNDGNKNITVATGAVASITLGDDADAATLGLDEFTGGSGDDMVIVEDAALNGDTLNGGSSNTDDDNGDTLDITTTANIDADALANVTNFEKIDAHVTNSSITFSDNNVAANQTVTVTATSSATAVAFDGTAETDGVLEFDLSTASAGANVNVTTDLNAANFTGKTSTFTGEDAAGSAIVLDLHADSATTLTAAELANVTDVDTLKVTGNVDWDITLSGNETDDGGDEAIAIDATALTTGNLTIDATNEQDQLVLTIDGAPAATNSITLTIDGVAYTHVVTTEDVAGTAAEDQAAVAAQLATLIDASDTVSATSAAGVITVTSTDGTAITYAETTDASNLVNDTEGVLAATVSVDAQNLTTGAVDLTVNQDHIANGLTVTGGGATTDTLTIEGEGALALAGNVTLIDNVELTQVLATTLTLADANTIDANSITINATSVAAGFTLDALLEVDGEVNVTSGSGDDVFKFNQVALDEDATQIIDIDGGSGSDELQLTGAGGTTLAIAALANITNVETITAMTADQDFALAISDNNASTAALTINLSAITTEAADLNIDASAETAQSINFIVDDVQFGAEATKDIITGGDGEDTLTITGNTATTIAEANIVSLTNVENIVLDGDLAHSLTLNDANVTGSNTLTIDATDVFTADNVITIDASAETTAKVVSQVNAGVVDEATITIANGNSTEAGDVITATINGTTFTYTTLAANESDTVMASGLADQIALNSDYALTDNAVGVITVSSSTKTIGTITTTVTETGVNDGITATYADTAIISVANQANTGDGTVNSLSATIAGVTYTYNAAGAAKTAQELSDGLTAAINGNAGLTATNAGGASLDITISKATALGNISTTAVETDGTIDGIGLSNSTEALNGSTLTGGAGIDTVELSAAGDSIFIQDEGSAAITATEKVIFTTATADVNFTVADASAAATMTYDATALTTGTLTFDGALESDNVLNVFGGAANDTITGGDMADVIRGGEGADTLTGGTGADRFVFNSDDFDGSADVITDFGTTDEIYLEITDAVDFNSDAMSWKSTGVFSTDASYATVTQVRKEDLGNGDTMIQFDQNGDGVSDQDITLTGVDATTVTTDSFVFG